MQMVNPGSISLYVPERLAFQREMENTLELHVTLATLYELNGYS